MSKVTIDGIWVELYHTGYIYSTEMGIVFIKY